MDTLLNIVVVEDHDALREVTVGSLRSLGHHVTGVDCAEALLDEGQVMPFDIMVLDLNLPGEDGISLARRLRRGQPDIGIIMVTARNQLTEKLAGYESGADIYLTKPTSTDELSAAIRALSRRIKASRQHPSALKLDLVRHTLAGAAGKVNLTARETAILAAFVRAPGHRLENWQLIGLLDKAETGYNKAAMEVQIVRLRKKLAQAGAAESIKAIREFGYQLFAEMILV